MCKTTFQIPNTFENRNVMCYNLIIFTRTFQPEKQYPLKKECFLKRKINLLFSSYFSNVTLFFIRYILQVEAEICEILRLLMNKISVHRSKFFLFLPFKKVILANDNGGRLQYQIYCIRYTCDRYFRCTVYLFVLLFLFSDSLFILVFHLPVLPCL